MDRPPEDPSPENPALDEPEPVGSEPEPEPVGSEPEQQSPPDPVSPYGPPAGADAEGAAVPDSAGPPARPYEWSPPALGENTPQGAPSEMAYPPVPRAPTPIGQEPMGSMPMAPPSDGPGSAGQYTRPGVGAGVATGCGLQVLAFILFFLTAGLMLNAFGALWPFILVTVGSALLMLSHRWRRFATGALIVCAATWIIVIGPCIALLGGFAG